MKLIESSFIKFVFPFAFEAETFEERLAVVEQATWPKVGSVWRKRNFPAEEILPHVSRYLNPPDGTTATAAVWRLESAALCDEQGLAAGAEDPLARWSLRVRKDALPFRILEAEFSLFRVGIGFLAITTRPESAESARWHDFLHFFRFAAGQRGVKLEARRRSSANDESPPDGEPFFPAAAGGLAEHADGRGTVDDLLRGLLNSAQLPGEVEPWWRDAFVAGRLVPFAALLVEDVAAEEVAPLLYRSRSFFHARQEVHLTDEDRTLGPPSIMPYAENQWLLFSLEGTAFVAVDPPDQPFFRETLPQNLRTQYYLLFLIALHQRFALIELSDRVARHWLTQRPGRDSRSRDEQFRRMYESLLAFTARGHFAQVAQRERHHRCYRQWQRIFEIESLYHEVSNEVHDMHDFLQARAAQRLEERINVLAAIFGVPGLIVGFLGINLYGVTAGAEGMNVWWAALGTAGVGLLAGSLALWLMRR